MKPLKYPWPPLLYIGACVTALLLDDYVVNAPLIDPKGTIALIAGAMIATGAIAINVWAIQTCMWHYTSLNPNQYPRQLIMDGPYRYSRNPIYLGYTLLMVAGGLILGNGWLMIAAPIAAILTTLIAIRYEELQLLVRFGVDFERYCQRTRRWI
ncbi:protein-S-isoprenylcysteine O-methyltransferase Ste14 [Agrobacterium vitis]|nr:protein-S-isoprenylcysteine O-methyltransferase Ste14 [Agrobacterium vitis]